MALSRAMDKDMMHLHNGILLSHGKELSNAICSNVDGPGDDYTKQDRERQTPHDVTRMWTQKYGANEPNNKIEASPQTQRSDCRYPGGGGGLGTWD